MSDKRLDACGCCEGNAPRSELYNTPGRHSIAYRIGTHSSFLGRLVARLPHEAIADGPRVGARPLVALTTRDRDDAAIALLDAGATVLDVVTFYQERIANEGFLRTATERRSLLELARGIGYELRPGVAAGAYLAFTVEDASGAPEVAIVRKGTPVQSVAAHRKSPQTFEISDEIEARSEWNALRPRLTQPQNLVVDAGTLKLVSSGGAMVPADLLYLEGTETNLKPGDLLLAALRATPADEIKWATIVVRHVEVDNKQQRTIVQIAETPVVPAWMPKWLGGISGKVFGAYLAMKGGTFGELVATWAPAKPTVKPREGLFAFRARVGFFGHNAPAHDTLLKPDGKPVFPNNWDDNGGTEIWADSGEKEYSTYGPADVYLERVVPEVVADSWAVFRSSTRVEAYTVVTVVESSLADFALSGRTTGLGLRAPNGTDPATHPEFKVRKATAYVQSERLETAELPIVDPLVAGQTSLELDELVELPAGRAVALSGKRTENGLDANEVLVITDIVLGATNTTLHFATGLEHGYVRDSVKLNANVVAATHGETVHEILGNGNGAAEHQRFVLKKPPLTYVSAQTGMGARSTLEVRVNGLRWDEEPSLYNRGAAEPVFIVRTGDDAKTTITFGDGEHGARLLSGMQNVVGTYRSGIGADGDVDAGALTTLQEKPLGIRSVTNPLPAEKGAGPEQLEAARRHAPLAVRTLDRIVSLEDFEDFASAFAGVGKARVATVPEGEGQLVVVTIAAEGGGQISTTSVLYSNLVGAMDGARDPWQRLRVLGYQPLFFEASAGLLVDPRYERAAVEAAVSDALLAAFSFDAREFGQPVTASEVVTAIQRVPGVAAADLDKLYLVSDAAGPAQTVPPPVLPAQLARREGSIIAPAELLLINPTGPTLTVMKA